jgi:mutator protein MutT
MAEHYKTLSAVFPILIKEEDGKKRILLAKRENTGYMDGMWDFAGSGHVDEGETAIHAIIREAKEEMGIEIEAEDVKFVHLSHRVGKNGNRTYYDIYFTIKKFRGQPRMTEPEKCSSLKWFDIDDLPEKMIPIRKNALWCYLNSEYYSELMIE